MRLARVGSTGPRFLLRNSCCACRQQRLQVSDAPCEAAIDADRPDRPVLQAGRFAQRLGFAIDCSGGRFRGNNFRKDGAICRRACCFHRVSFPACAGSLIHDELEYWENLSSSENTKASKPIRLLAWTLIHYLGNFPGSHSPGVPDSPILFFLDLDHLSPWSASRRMFAAVRGPYGPRMPLSAAIAATLRAMSCVLDRAPVCSSSRSSSSAI